jgi:hypothetical protein
MKKISIACMAIMISGVVWAQSPANTPDNTPSPEVSTKEFMKDLEEDLKLTDDQKKSITQFTLDKKAKILKARSDYEARMKNTLTASQYRKWGEMNSMEDRYIYNP